MCYKFHPSRKAQNTLMTSPHWVGWTPPCNGVIGHVISSSGLSPSAAFLQGATLGAWIRGSTTRSRASLISYYLQTSARTKIFNFRQIKWADLHGLLSLQARECGRLSGGPQHSIQVSDDIEMHVRQITGIVAAAFQDTPAAKRLGYWRIYTLLR